MAAGEHQPESIIRLPRRRLLQRSQLVAIVSVAPKLVQGAVTSYRHQPRSWTRRNAFYWPPLKGDQQGILDDFFCNLEIAQDANERAQHSTGLLAKDSAERDIGLGT
jgi:hypothetical protein